MAGKYAGMTKEERRAAYEQEERQRKEDKFLFRSRSIAQHYVYLHQFEEGDHAENLARTLGLPLATAQAWLSGEHDFTLREIALLESVSHGDNAISVAMHGTYGLSSHYPQAKYKKDFPWKLYDDNHVSQPLVNYWADLHDTWCHACNWSGTYEDFHRLNEEMAFKRPFTREGGSCCPNCKREFTLVDIE